MLSYAVLVQCPERKPFLEVLNSSLSFLKSCSPKARQGIRFYLQDPPVSAMDILELTRQSGMSAQFRIMHAQDVPSCREAGHEMQILIQTGKMSRDAVLQQVCRPGRVLVHYYGRALAVGQRAPWHLEIFDPHADKREERLQHLLRQLLDDPSALSYMRRQAMEHYNRHCNQLTRQNLLQAMGSPVSGRGEVLR